MSSFKNQTEEAIICRINECIQRNNLNEMRQLYEDLTYDGYPHTLDTDTAFLKLQNKIIQNHTY